MVHWQHHAHTEQCLLWYIANTRLVCSTTTHTEQCLLWYIASTTLTLNNVCYGTLAAPHSN